MITVMPRQTGTLLVAVLALAGAAEPAFAQQSLSQGTPVPRRAGGSVRTVDADVSISATHDSNAARSSAVRAAQAGLQRSDTTILPSANVNISIPSGRNTFTLAGSAGYDFNVRNKRRNGERIGLSGGLATNFRLCETSVTAGITRQRSDISNFIGTAGGALAFINNIETTLEVGGDLSCGRDIGLRPFGSIYYTRGRNTQEARVVSDYDTVSYGGGLIYTQPSIGELGVIGSVDKTTYPQRPDGSLTLGQPSFSARSIGVFFNRESARILKARLRVNYTDVDPGVSANAFKGLSGEASLRLVPGGKVSFEARSARAAMPSLSFNVDYIVETGTFFSVTAPLTTRVSLRAQADHRERDYYGGVTNVVNPLLDDSVSTLSASLDWKVNRRLALGLTSAYEWRRANDVYYDYESARIGLVGRLAL
jgi:hypothetical protein